MMQRKKKCRQEKGVGILRDLQESPTLQPVFAQCSPRHKERLRRDTGGCTRVCLLSSGNPFGKGLFGLLIVHLITQKVRGLETDMHTNIEIDLGFVGLRLNQK